MKRTYLFLFLLISVISFGSFADDNVRTVVSVVKGHDTDKMVRRAVQLVGDIPGRVKKWDRVFIKVSLDDAKPADSGLVTNVEVVRTIIKMCKEAGASRITIVDGSLKTNTWKAFEAAGYNKMAKEEGVILKDLDADYLWRSWLEDGQGYKKYSIAMSVLNCEVFINVPVVKPNDDPTHPELSLSNMLGIMCDKWTKRHLPKDDKLDQLIVAMNQIKQSDLVVIDGTKYGGFVIAGNDCVSADITAMKMLRLDTDNVKYLKLAESKGLGTADIAKIEVKNEKI